MPNDENEEVERRDHFSPDENGPKEPKENYTPEPDQNDPTDEITALLRNTSDDEALAEALGDYHENDIASVLEELDSGEQERLLTVLDNETASEVLAYADNAGELLGEMEAERAADLLEEMDADDAADILEEMDEEKRDALIDLLEPEAKEDIELINSYPDDSFGSIMTTNFVSFPRDLTVKQAMKTTVAQAADNDNISTLYTTDENGRFYGAIDLKDLIVARQDTDLESLTVTSFPTVFDTDSVSENLERVRGYAEDSIPVLSSVDGTILGVVTATGLAEAVKDDLGDDYAKLAGLTEGEAPEEGLFQSVRKRIPWLIVLLFLGIGVSFVVGLFEGVVKQVALIVCFQSLILDMAGNVGTQSLAVTIRTVADETPDFRRRLGLIFKEMRVGLCNGLLLGTGSFLLIGLYVLFSRGVTPAFAFSVSGCVGLALTVSMIVSSILGTATPLFFRRIGVDPAVASGPLITTVNDLTAVCIYYGTAWLLLIRLLGFGA